MDDLDNIFGKRLRALEETPAFIGNPGSGVIDLIPPGGLTNKIYSYLGSGYYQIEPDGDGPFKYVKDGPAVEVVPENSKDESSIFGNAFSLVGSIYSNSTTWAKKNAGFVATGFDESIKDFGTGTDKYIRYGLIGGGIYLAIQIIKLIRE